MTEPSPTVDDTEIFRQLETYPWDKDKEFQGGLLAILGPDPSPSQLSDLTLRAQCFYLSRKTGLPISFDAYKTYLSSKKSPQPQSQSQPPETDSSATMSIPSTTPTSSNDTDAPYPPTFLQIVSLIQSGAPIPGIIDIPDTVLTGQGSAATAPKRRKPWEKEDTEDGAVGGTFGDVRDEKPIEQELPEEEEEKLEA